MVDVSVSCVCLSVFRRKRRSREFSCLNNYTQKYPHVVTNIVYCSEYIDLPTAPSSGKRFQQFNTLLVPSQPKMCMCIETNRNRGSESESTNQVNDYHQITIANKEAFVRLWAATKKQKQKQQQQHRRTFSVCVLGAKLGSFISIGKNKS